MAGQLAPAVGGDLAIARIQANNNVAWEGAAGVAQKTGVLDGGRTNNDVGQAQVEIGFDGVQVANAPANLNGDFVVDDVQDVFDGGQVFRAAGNGAVQVNQVQASRALVEPVGGHGRGVFRENGGVVQVALAQAYAVSVFEVDSGNQKHDGFRLS